MASRLSLCICLFCYKFRFLGHHRACGHVSKWLLLVLPGRPCKVHRVCLVFVSPPILSRCCALSRMLGVSCRILDCSGWCVTLQHSHHLLCPSISFVCTFMFCWQEHLWLLLECSGPGFADGCVALAVGSDGLSGEGRRLRCHVGILYFEMGACAR